MISCPKKKKRSNGGLGSRGRSNRNPLPYVPTQEEARATLNPNRTLPRMQSSLSRVEPGASGIGGVPGFIKPAGMAAIVTHLRDKCKMRSKGSLFCDIGCGEARPVLAAMEACPRIGGALGIDVDDITLTVARRNLDRFMKLKWNGERYITIREEEPDTTPPCCILHSDITHLRDLGCITHAYTFCNGMPPLVLKHLFRVCASSTSLRYIVIVYKKKKGDLANDLVEMLEETTTSLHKFSNPETGRSLLQMPGQVAHGCCFHISGRAREIFSLFSDGLSPVLPSTGLDACLVNTSPRGK